VDLTNVEGAMEDLVVARAEVEITSKVYILRKKKYRAVRRVLIA